MTRLDLTIIFIVKSSRIDFELHDKLPEMGKHPPTITGCLFIGTGNNVITL
jgi:hypothetical protein